MPTYEYQCSKCGAVFEVFQSINDPPVSRCEKCGREGCVERLVGSGAGLIFKGSGFYITDYKRSGGEKKAESAEKSKGEKSEKKAAGGSSSTTSSSSSSSDKSSDKS